jgi:hypothetical protein
VVIPRRRAPWLAASALLVLVAGLLRWAASLGDFWFDEIWSWSMTLDLSSPWAVLTRIRHENNHFLNTLILDLLGPERHWTVYRLPAVLASTASTVLAARIAAHGRGPVEALAALWLTGLSYLSVHFGSEARGYAYVVFFALLAFVLLHRALERASWTIDLLVALSLVLGVLSQLMFLYAWAALFTWHVLRAGRMPGGFATVLRVHLPPALFCAWLYVVNLRSLTLGGGEPRPTGELAVGVLSLFGGGPDSGPAAWLVAALVAVALGLALAEEFRSGSDLWVPFAGVVGIAPLLLFAVARPRGLYERYFLLAVAFGLILSARWIGRIWARGPAGKAACALLLALFTIGNGIHTARLIRLGRGHYGEALQWMLDESRTRPAGIASDHDFRNGLVYSYYKRWTSAPRDLDYHMENQLPREGTEWFLRHDLRTDQEPPPTVHDRNGNSYRLARVFPYAGLSGWRWAVYRNARLDG